MKKFLQDRGNLKEYSKIKYYDSDGSPYLYIEDPRLLAGFAGYLKFQCLKQSICNKVFCRGQNRDFKIIPSLFRDVDGIVTDNERILLRQKAYEELVQKITPNFNLTEHSLKSLELEGLPDDIINKLKTIKKKKINGKEELLKILNFTIGDEQTVRYKSLILKHAKPTNLYKAYRFENENINAILQHYGIRTHWIDLVDNIYIAIWFATRKLILNENGLAYFVKSPEEFGWVYFIAMNDELEYYDLRENHSSLSLRLHVQHGISATRKNNDWNINNRYLDDFVIARVKFPNDEIWDLNNLMFTTKYFFPDEDIDNTYKLLRKPKFRKVLNEIIEKYKLKESEIGSILEYVK